MSEHINPIEIIISWYSNCIFNYEAHNSKLPDKNKSAIDTELMNGVPEQPQLILLYLWNKYLQIKYGN